MKLGETCQTQFIISNGIYSKCLKMCLQILHDEKVLKLDCFFAIGNNELDSSCLNKYEPTFMYEFTESNRSINEWMKTCCCSNNNNKNSHSKNKAANCPIDYLWYEWNCVNRFTNQLQHKIISAFFVFGFCFWFLVGVAVIKRKFKCGGDLYVRL